MELGKDNNWIMGIGGVNAFGCKIKCSTIEVEWYFATSAVS